MWKSWGRGYSLFTVTPWKVIKLAVSPYSGRANTPIMKRKNRETQTPNLKFHVWHLGLLVASSVTRAWADSALPALLLVEHVGSFGSVLLSVYSFPQQMSRVSGTSCILRFPFQFRLSLHSFMDGLLRSSLQRHQPCYMLPGLWDFLNLSVSLITYSLMHRKYSQNHHEYNISFWCQLKR